MIKDTLMKNFGRIAATFVMVVALAATPAFARFGGGGYGGGRSFGGGSSGFGGGYHSSFGGGSSGYSGGYHSNGGGSFGGGSSGYSGGYRSNGGGSFGGGSFGGSRSYSTPAPAAAPPSSGRSFGGGSFGGGSFGGGRPTQSFGGGFRSGSTYSSNRVAAPNYRGVAPTYQYYGGRSVPFYYAHPWAAYSFGWLAPHPWYYSYNPFWPGFYFHQPYYYGGGYVPGGFNFLNMFFGLGFFVVIVLLIASALRRIRA